MFRTNDPDRPEVAIEASVSRVKAGVSTIPTSASFGTLSLGTKARQVLDVYDSADKPRTVEQVTSYVVDEEADFSLPAQLGNEHRFGQDDVEFVQTPLAGPAVARQRRCAAVDCINFNTPEFFTA